MNYLIVKSKCLGDHVHTRFFSGESPTSTGFNGELIFRIPEWRIFCAALLAGAGQLNGHLTVIMDDVAEVLSSRWS